FKEFWSLNIKVTPAVLIPRPETEALVEKALEKLVHSPLSIVPGPTILDLCTGSGCIAAALATELPEAQITVADISNEALDVARQNLEFAKDRVTFIQSDLFEKIEGRFDLIVSNPPYIPSSQMKQLSPEILRYEPCLALDGGPDGLDFIAKIKQTAPQFLNPKGWLVVEAGPEIFTWTNS
ncbi:MAG: peptide chain release factor N(5)-glutamine methyltransferase, partial [bacterium]|nr:peptide chain release factor N(5)-glutamine methyltransferase [bacterium]